MTAATSPSGRDATSAPPTEPTRTPEHLRILSKPEWVESVVMFLKERATAAGVCDGDAVNRLVISMSEAITNAIVHGNLEIDSRLKESPDGAFTRTLKERAADPSFAGRVVDIRVDYEPDKCVWTVTDQGRGFDFAKLLKKLDSDEPDLSLSSGRGVAIMRAFVDEVRWDQGGRQIRLAVHFRKGSERRVDARCRYVAAVGLKAEGWESTSEGIARDLSSSGMALVATCSAPVGTRVTVTLDLRKPTQREITGTVVRCLDLSGPFYDIGIHFDQRIDVGAYCAS